jgi:dTDP-4-dehydrorhamnose reductase
MRLLLFGGTGQIGTELRALAASSGVELVAPTRAAVDLEDSAAITNIIAAGPWSAVINCAGYTNVDGAESEEATAFAINAKAPSQLAAETGRHRIPLIHISTDYVFNGCKGAPYVEDDAPAPLSAYGRSKLAGERGAQAGNPCHVIVRTAWVYSPFGKNFVRTIVRLAQERDRLTVVADQRGCPTAARDIAKACIDIALRCAEQPERVPYGIYHYVGAGEATWFDFASAIVQLAAVRTHRSPQVVPIRTIDYPTAAFRPADARLECAKIVRNFGVVMRPWRDALAETINRMLTDTGIA